MASSGAAREAGYFLSTAWSSSLRTDLVTAAIGRLREQTWKASSLSTGRRRPLSGAGGGSGDLPIVAIGADPGSTFGTDGRIDDARPPPTSWATGWLGHQTAHHIAGPSEWLARNRG